MRACGTWRCWRRRSWPGAGLGDLVHLNGSAALTDEWIDGIRARWAARRASASETGSDGSAWLGGKAVALLSGPGGLASYLRRRQLGSRLAGRSLPLDVGVTTDIPAAIRRAVIERDQHCRFPSGCDQPAAGCEVHHLTRKADGGKTSVKDCALFCTHHHQVEIHRNGWTVVLNPDGTTTAWNKDKTKILHSHTRNHSPPARPR